MRRTLIATLTGILLGCQPAGDRVCAHTAPVGVEFNIVFLGVAGVAPAKLIYACDRWEIRNS